MPVKKRKNLLFFSILIMVFLMGCSPLLRHKVLSFLFDGVPAMDHATTTVSDSLRGEDSIRNSSAATAGKNAIGDIYLHPPFRDKKCLNCHSNGPGTLPPLKPPDLCYTCHESWWNKFKMVHGPVASGYCLKCHHQHQGKYPKMLLRTGRDLCLFCHDSKQIFMNPIHKLIGSRNCIECHSPHGGENKGMLKPPDACFNCHEDFRVAYKWLHGPVSSGNCLKCHGSHLTGIKKLQLRSGQQICLYCHDSKQILRNVAHKDIKETICIACHNPHGGADRYILRIPAQALLDSTRIARKNDSLDKINSPDMHPKDSLLLIHNVENGKSRKDSLSKSNILTIEIKDSSLTQSDSLNAEKQIPAKEIIKKQRKKEIEKKNKEPKSSGVESTNNLSEQNAIKEKEKVSKILETKYKQNIYVLYYISSINEIDTANVKFKRFFATISAIVEVSGAASISISPVASGKFKKKVAKKRGEKAKEKLVFVLKENGIDESKVKFSKIEITISGSSSKITSEESLFIKLEVY